MPVLCRMEIGGYETWTQNIWGGLDMDVRIMQNVFEMY